MTDFTIDLCKKSEQDSLLQGEPVRFRYTPYVEANYKIDCSEFNRLGIFKQSKTVALSCYGKFNFEIEYEQAESSSEQDRIVIRYKLNNERFIQEQFQIAWLERTFGKQPYFICPATGKRVKHLLIVAGLLKSRYYFRKMHYYSEHGSIRDRGLRGSRKIRGRLGLDKAICVPIRYMPKPKNMHRTTWAKICSKEDGYYQIIEDAQNAFLDKFRKKGWDF